MGHEVARCSTGTDQQQDRGHGTGEVDTAGGPQPERGLRHEPEGLAGHWQRIELREQLLAVQGRQPWVVS